MPSVQKRSTPSRSSMRHRCWATTPTVLDYWPISRPTWGWRSAISECSFSALAAPFAAYSARSWNANCARWSSPIARQLAPASWRPNSPTWAQFPAADSPRYADPRTISSSTPPRPACKEKCRRCRWDWSGKTVFATTWRTAAATPRLPCGRSQLHAARTTRAGACWWNRRQNRSCWRGIRPDTAPVLEALARHA